MAVNLATKYSSKVDERFKLGSLTEAAVNHNYDWAGVETVAVYSIPTVALTPYTRSGVNRYGVPGELQDTKQEMKVTKDDGFTFTIDKANKQDSMNVRDAGKALRRQIDEVVTPTIDKRRIEVMITKAMAGEGTNEPAAITKDNAYEAFLTANEFLDEKKVPTTGRIALVTPKFFKCIKLDPMFVKASDMGQKIAINGLVGEIDGVKIIKVPSTYFTNNVEFIVNHPSAVVAVEKLQDYKIHNDAPGISGNLVEGRVRYDAYVLNSKADGIYAYQGA